MPAVLHVSPRRTHAGLQLCLGGELDIATAQHLVSLTARLDTADVALLWLDLTELEFLDAAGLRALLSVHSSVASRGGRLVLTGLRPLARRMLEITGLDGTLHVDQLSPVQVGSV